MSDPLDEILEAAGIPRDHPTRSLADRGTHRVVTPAVEPRPIVMHHTTTDYAADIERFMRRLNERFAAEDRLQLQQWQREYLKVWPPDSTTPVLTRNDPPT